ncbi:Fe-S-oxidoreductase [Clostridium sp. WB02_MRS01]|nr:Fe-S-oxidoreductase [Clostridium sp. WB02_MRS01]
MDIIKNIKVPTGNILITNGEKGKLECLSIGDYGRNENVKAQFLGLNKDIEGVANGLCMPLEEKWVITLSTQYGCSMACKFCDVPKVGKGINANYEDIKGQIEVVLSLHPEVLSTKRLNIHYARMGEPSWNPDVLKVSYDLHKIVRPFIGNSLIHPVFTTMLPKNNKNLFSVLQEWTNDIKNDLYRGDAGLQLSINSTSDTQREYMFSGNSLPLVEISDIINDLPMPKGRKYALNFALADEYEVDAKHLRRLFDPEKCMIKITPLHITHSCEENDIKTTGGYTSFVPYQKVERELIDAGFDVLVFIPSMDEDEGRITCGNAILSGSMPECRYEEIE